MSWFTKRSSQGGSANVVSRKGFSIHREAASEQQDEPSSRRSSSSDVKVPLSPPRSPKVDLNSSSGSHGSVLPKFHQQVVGSSMRKGGRGKRLVLALLRWLLLAFAGCVTALVVMLLFRGAQSALQAWKARAGGAGSKQVFDVSNKQLLSFSVCNSMAEQRLAVVSGAILAFELGRVVMLPDLLVDGAEGPDRGRTMPFAQMYDADHFIAALAERGMEAVDPHRAFPKELFTPSYIPEVADPVEELALKHRTTKHLHVECPLHRLPRVYYTGANSRIMWAVLDALQPSKELAQHVKVMLRELNRQTHHSAYSFLHLPIDTDWLKACSATVNSTTKNTCRSNVESIDLVLLNLNVPVTEPLYVSADWAKVPPEAVELAMKKLQMYKMYTSKDFKPQLSGEVEVNALVEYHVAMAAHMFMGNAMHPFSALSIVHRRHRNQWASYYNGGHMPLVDLMPLDQLAWVFTYSSETPHLDYLVKAMVSKQPGL
ncbi:hypothetical protein DUNSADRAFT_7904 [Dunaliella salina]|uniref:O-fucosyltransferase family protein n=1 Tax=Dunaliella salina TaxID=3046 RepID=A0ABQ7GKH4_DUNSA|nr:hypothetical protein DUNSADRAFT_7904 [Dunaliella salina]|eukprot:KAF5835098.1 hypothetical protein DUNSADRAFT_7904 [Dunaliella salina]